MKFKIGSFSFCLMAFLLTLCFGSCDTDTEDVGPEWTSYLYDKNNVEPGVSYYKHQFDNNSRQAVVYIAGNLPIVISVPHGGYYEPSSITDRDCSGTSNDTMCGRDKETMNMALGITETLKSVTGKFPHVIYNKLDRSKLDANRGSGAAYAQGSATSPQAWLDFHDFIVDAKNRAMTEFGTCLYIDLHGNSNTDNVIIGYHLTKDNLNTIDSNDIASTSLRVLYENILNSTVPLEELIIGSRSFGTILNKYYNYSSYDIVPSAAHTNPSGYTYYWGGEDSYNLFNHCVLQNDQGVRGIYEPLVTGMQMELESVHATDAFYSAMANALNEFLKTNEFMD